MKIEDEAANKRHLIDFLRREAAYSGVWFADQLARAADTLSTQATTIARLREALEALVDAYGSFSGRPFDLPGDHPVVHARAVLAALT